MMIQKASEKEIQKTLAELGGWTVQKGKLHREYNFRDFAQAFGFMTLVALFAERMEHHPEWFNAYRKVVIDLMTHEAQGVTTKDLDMACEMEKIADLFIK
ncbi:MAG: 4a-hydroxytetrahydrobiopterin dehydratase [Methanosarcinaceae archaeon]|nr:4a-hydroxytetrahydrobiopterin dehydratase [Methanosarcinaceae archaeon]